MLARWDMSCTHVNSYLYCSNVGTLVIRITSIEVAVKHVNNFKLCRSREGGNPVACVEKSLDPRLRGDDELNIFNRRINKNPVVPINIKSVQIP